MYTGGGNTLEIIKRDGSSIVWNNHIYSLDIPSVSNKTVEEIKSLLLNAVKVAGSNGYRYVSIQTWGAMNQFFTNLGNDSFVIPPNGLWTIEVSNINPNGTYAHVEAYSYNGERYCGTIYSGSFNYNVFNTGQVATIPVLQSKLSSLEKRIQALENK